MEKELLEFGKEKLISNKVVLLTLLLCFVSYWVIAQGTTHFFIASKIPTSPLHIAEITIKNEEELINFSDTFSEQIGSNRLQGFYQTCYVPSFEKNEIDKLVFFRLVGFGGEYSNEDILEEKIIIFQPYRELKALKGNKNFFCDNDGRVVYFLMSSKKKKYKKVDIEISVKLNLDDWENEIKWFVMFCKNVSVKSLNQEVGK